MASLRKKVLAMISTISRVKLCLLVSETATSGGSRIFKRGGGHKIMDACTVFVTINLKVGDGQK